MRRALPLVLAGVLLAACGDAADPATPAADPSVLLPEESGAVPIVVLVPGGGWASADPSGLRPLARQLADAGYVSATTTYRTVGDNASFPTPVEDVLCAAAAAVAEAGEAGRSGGPLILVGHSAGGQLAVLSALRPSAFHGECDDPAVTPDAVVGLAGAYDVTRLGGLAENLFGVPEAEDPDLWREGDVHAWVQERPTLPVLLVHGDLDAVVPVSSSLELGDALSDAGHPTEVETLAGVDHLEVFRADVVGPVLSDWIADVAADR